MPPPTMVVGNASCKLLVGALFDSGIQVQCVRGEHIWVGPAGGWGGGGFQPGVYVPLEALFLYCKQERHGGRYRTCIRQNKK